MRKGINMNINETLGSKLINSMSFGESMFLAGFNLKTAKEDLFFKGNQTYPRRYPCRKTLEDSRR